MTDNKINETEKMKLSKEEIVANLKQHRKFYILLGSLLVLNINIILNLVEFWSYDDNYSHGFFIIPISIWLIYRKRNELSFPSKMSTQGILLFIVGVAFLVMGTAASELFTTRVGWIGMITGLSMYYLGWSNFKKVWFAFFFLLFMIPVPSIIYYAAALPLQHLASDITVLVLKVLGVPVIQAGNVIHLPDYSLEVVEACSGLRSLVTLLALGSLYGYMFMPTKSLGITVFIFTIPIAIVTNIFRVTVTAIGAYAISKEIAEDFLHELSGFIVFFSALILMLILGAVLKWLRNRFISL